MPNRLDPKRALASLFAPQNRVDWALGAVGVAFGALSLPLPFGRDQGLYFYVGREWLEHGMVPYKDLFEQKTPGIFMAYALAIALFGKHMWSSRLLELLAVTALGASSAFALTPRDQRPQPGVIGASVAGATFVYYFFFTFWDSGQCEVWCASLSTVALALALRLRRPWAAAVGAGLLTGAAFVFKPPCAPLFAVVALAFLFRARSEGLRAAALGSAAFAGAAALAPCLTLAYFWAKGALPAMRDVLVGANGYYWEHERGAHDWHDVVARMLSFYQWHEPISSLLLEALVVSTAVAIARRDRPLVARHVLAWACAIAGAAAVTSQMKFYHYHWGVIVMATTLTITNLAMNAAALAKWRLGGTGAAGAALVVSNLAIAALLGGKQTAQWGDEVASVIAYESGSIDRATFSHRIGFGPPLDYNFGETEAVGLWLAENTTPADLVAVRGFEPEIYAVADRRYDGRFFWTSQLTVSTRAYRREDYLAEDAAWLDAHPPRFVVAGKDDEGPDAPAFFYARGYALRAKIGYFLVLEKK